MFYHIALFPCLKQYTFRRLVAKEWQNIKLRFALQGGEKQNQLNFICMANSNLSGPNFVREIKQHPGKVLNTSTSIAAQQGWRGTLAALQCHPKPLHCTLWSQWVLKGAAQLRIHCLAEIFENLGRPVTDLSPSHPVWPTGIILTDGTDLQPFKKNRP